MKAYLVTTGTLFALITVMHVLRAVWERGLLKTEPAGYLSMTALTFVAAGMSAWACGARGPDRGSSASSPPALGLGRSRQRVVGPGVTRVADFEVLADLEISRRPEAFQVVGDLHGAKVGGQ